MHSESKLNRLTSRAAGWAAPLLVLGALAAAGSVRAEDPLLGQIKVIKCVGCDPGAVTLVIHDPIDVRDFEVQIQESDYQKIITPLPGKTVYDKDGCFYWMDMPKEPKKDSAKAGLKKTSAKPAPKKKDDGDSAAAGGDAGAPQGTPSRCIPYVKSTTKPSEPSPEKKGE